MYCNNIITVDEICDEVLIILYVCKVEKKIVMCPLKKRL